MTSPSQTAIVISQAHHDGINSYTSQPIQPPSPQADQSKLTAVASPGVAVAVVDGAVGGLSEVEMYKRLRVNPTEDYPNYFQRQHDLAAQEVIAITTPGVCAQQCESQAALAPIAIATSSTPSQLAPNRMSEWPIGSTTVSSDVATISQESVDLSSEYVPTPLDTKRPSTVLSTTSVSTVGQLHIPGEFPRESRRTVI